MSSIDTLLAAKPLWAKVAARLPTQIELEARPPSPSGSIGRAYDLIIRESGRRTIDVLEVSDKAILPACCPERHINYDATFCIGLGSSNPLTDAAEATKWWNDLNAFLNYQIFAERQGYWPPYAQLCHGDAAYQQLEMERLAETIGWKDEVIHGIFRKAGWLAGDLPRILKDKKTVANLRSPCPRGCRRWHFPLRPTSCAVPACTPSCKKQHKPVIRRDCPHRVSVENLVRLEHKRRRSEQRFIKELRRRGVGCCGSMKFCPLRDASD